MSVFGPLSAGWVIVVMIILVVFIVIALVQKRQAMATGVVKAFAIFIVLTMGYIFIINKIQLTSMSNIFEGFKVYFNWLGSFVNKAVEITSYAIGQDWTANTTK